MNGKNVVLQHALSLQLDAAADGFSTFSCILLAPMLMLESH